MSRTLTWAGLLLATATASIACGPDDVQPLVAQAGVEQPQVFDGTFWRIPPPARDPNISVGPEVAPEQPYPVDDVGSARATPPDALLPLEPPRFQRLEIPILQNHIGRIATPDILGYGLGAAFVDYDADGRLDLFVAQPAAFAESPACVYRNVSEPGLVMFDDTPLVCVGSGWNSGTAIDVDGDGRDELLIYGGSSVALVRSFPLPNVSLVYRPEGRLIGLTNAALPIDLDADGDLDVIISCAIGRDGLENLSRDNVVLINDNGTLAISDEYPQLSVAENTVSHAAFDSDDDGLTDIVRINDTFSRIDRANTSREPGGWLLRCDPDQSCLFVGLKFFESSQAWGSFMGAAVVQTVAHGVRLALGDWHVNRLAPLPNDRGADATWATGFAERVYRRLFGWGIVVDDFDDNGLDDLLVARGHFDGSYAPSVDDHHDVLYLQRETGQFVAFSNDIGLPGPSRADSHNPDRWYSSRAFIRADLDRDGDLEFLQVPREGELRLFESSVGDRCTIRPLPSVVMSSGWGYRWRADDATPWRWGDVQGTQRVGPPPMLFVHESTTELRFPSGYVAPIDCAVGDYVEVAEPDWVRVDRRDDVIHITIDLPADVVEVAVRNPAGDVSVVDATAATDNDGDVSWVIEVSDASALMLNIDGRWVERWWPLGL